MVEIISLSDKLREGKYNLHSSFDKAANFILSSKRKHPLNLAFVVDKIIGNGPLNIVVNGISINKIKSLAISKNQIILNDTILDVNQNKRYCSRFRISNKEIQKHKKVYLNYLKLVKKCIIAYSSSKSLAFLIDKKRIINFNSSFEKELVKKFSETIPNLIKTIKIILEKKDIKEDSGNFHNLIKIIKPIKGLGIGFTPSGDDFISGLLLSLSIFGSAIGTVTTELSNVIYKNAKGTNLISNTFLYCSKQGYLSENFKETFSSILAGNENEIIKNTRRLLSVGETSGSDICVGFFIMSNLLLNL